MVEGSIVITRERRDAEGVLNTYELLTSAH